MAFQLSPGVLVKEIDLTNIVPAVATSIGAIAAGFPQGPVEEIIPIGSEQELVNFFGNPTQITLRHGLLPPTSCNTETLFV